MLPSSEAAACAPAVEASYSVVIPAYNEADAIEETLHSIASVMGDFGRPYEVIVVDDGSTDRTAERATGTNVHLIRHPTNGGYGRALLTGIVGAAHENIIIVDADGTYPIKSLPNLLETYDRGFDMVVGARTGRHFEPSSWKRFLRLFFRILAEYACGQSIPDINSGFRVFKRDPVVAMRSSISTGFSFTTTITLLFMLNGYFVGYLPIGYHARIGKSKVKLVRDSLRSLQIISTAIAQYNPLKLYLLLAIVSVVSGLVIGLAGLVLPPAALGVLLTAGAGWLVSLLIAAIAILALVTTRPRPYER